MNIVDVNVMLYAVNVSSAHHRAAREWLAESLGGGRTVGFAWTAMLAFVRLTTSRTIFERPLPAAAAFDVLDAWLAAPGAVVVEPGPRHLRLLRGLLQGAGTAGNLTSDAHLAALALEQGGSIVTFDRDFQRFGVGVVVPG